RQEDEDEDEDEDGGRDDDPDHGAPFAARRASAATVSDQAGVAFSEGTRVKRSPPRPSHCSRARMPISSSVSRQSATKAGQKTATRRMPRAASSGRTRSV